MILNFKKRQYFQKDSRTQVHHAPDVHSVLLVHIVRTKYQEFYSILSISLNIKEK